MSSSRGHIDQLTPELMSKYLSGQLSHEEMHAIEKLMLESDFEAEAMEGFEEASVDLEQDLSILNRKLEKRIRSEKTMFPFWFKIAASVLILALSTVVVLNWDTGLSEEAVTQSTHEDNAAPDDPESSGESLTESMDLSKDTLIALNEVEETVSETDHLITGPDNTAGHDKEPTVAEAVENTLDIVEAEQAEVVADLTEEKFMEDNISEESNISQDERPAPAVAKKEKIDQTMQESRQEVRTRSAAIKIRGSSSIATREVRGQVRAEGDGEALPGVNVLIKGTIQGTVTDIDGNYNLSVPDIPGQSLVFSFVGLQAREVDITDKATLDVELTPDETKLSEIVVTAQGVEERRQMIGYSVKKADEPKVITPARPATGKSGYKNYLEDNIRIPNDSLSGKVIVKFDVLPNGTLTNFTTEKSPGPEYANEAVRLIMEGPKWLPAYEDSTAIKDRVRVKVRFR